MRVIKNPAWVYYLADTDPHFDEVKVGKWMYFFGDRQVFANRITIVVSSTKNLPGEIAIL